jgi:hypothetical protein
MSDFAEKLRELGPLGEGEDLDRGVLRVKLDALGAIVPYVKLVEREKLRVPEKSEAAYGEYYGSAEVDRLFHAMIDERLAVGQILMLLREGPLSIVEIAGRLDLDPSAVSKHLTGASRRGLLRYDLDGQRYALVGAG